MSDYEQLHQPQTQAVASAVEQLGISTELLAELTPDEARLVLGGVAKSLATLLHPDQARHTDIRGLEAADVNQLAATISHADDKTITDAIRHSANMSLTLQYRQREAALQDEIDREKSISKQLVEVILQHPETIAEHVNAHVLLTVNTDEASADPTFISMTIADGTVTQARETTERGMLLDAFPQYIQKHLMGLRPDLYGPVHYVHMGDVFPGQSKWTDWAILTTATARHDTSIKKPAVKLLRPQKGKAPQYQDYIGGRPIGILTYDHINNLMSQLHTDRALNKAVNQSAGGGSPLRLKELAHMIQNGYVSLLTDAQVPEESSLVLVKPATRSGEGTVHITGETLAVSHQIR